MYLLIVVLNKEEFLEDVLSVLVELGVTDATIIDSQAMGRALAYEVPIFAGLRFQMGGGRPYSKTIFALVEDKEVGAQMVRMLKEVDIDLESPGVGCIITIKIESALGTPSELDLE
ncbi:MAG TPA: hypothetical protein EYP53_08200 [Candidatus Latescibacteria bacterium]|nr:hypothetical protein [Candidatus Latescibacterota bacterium]